MYINARSYYSLRYGTMSIKELVANAAECGVATMALTDINNCTGVFDFVRTCVKNGIQPSVGMEIRNANVFLLCSSC